MTFSSDGSGVNPTHEPDPETLGFDDFIEVHLDEGELPELEILRRQFLDEARELAARGGRRDQILEVLRIGFFQERGRPEDWARSYYRLAVEAVAAATREAEDALGIKPDVAAPTAITLDELRSARTAPECFVEDLLFADVRLVAAAGGTGKTTLMLLELAALAGGAETLYGHRVLRHGPVVYFSGEDSREVIVARLREVIGANGMLGQVATILRRFYVADVSGTSFRLSAIVNDTVVASDEVDRLVGWLQAIEPVAIVIDPLASFSVGEGRTNDSEQAIIGVARRIRNALGCCVSVVHHVGKQNARDGAVDQYAFRGGSALADGARMVGILSKLDGPQWSKATGTELAEYEDGIRLAIAKSTYVRRPQDVFLRRSGYHFAVAQLGGALPNAEQIRESMVLGVLQRELNAGKFPTQNLLTGDGRASLLPTLSKAAIRDTIESLTYKGQIERRPIPNRSGRGGARDYLHPIPALALATPEHQSEPAPPNTSSFDAPGFGDPLRQQNGSAAIAAAALSDRWCADQQSNTIGAPNHQSPMGSPE